MRVTVQAACGNSVLQDSRVIRVLGESFPHSLHRPAWVYGRGGPVLSCLALGCRGVQEDLGSVTGYVALLKCPRLSDLSFSPL